MGEYGQVEREGQARDVTEGAAPRQAATLVLFRDDNSNGKAVHVTHDESVSLEDYTNQEQFTELLSGYNEGGGLFLVSLPTVGSNPSVYDENGDEVGTEFVTLG